MKLAEAAGLLLAVRRPPDHRRPGPLERLPAEGRAAHLLRQPPEPLRLGADLGRAAAATCARDHAPIAARDYWTATPLKHWITREVFNAVYVSRQRTDDQDPLEPLVEALRNGDSLVIFPEGTRSNKARAAAVQERAVSTWPSSSRRCS